MMEIQNISILVSWGKHRTIEKNTTIKINDAKKQ